MLHQQQRSIMSIASAPAPASVRSFVAPIRLAAAATPAASAIAAPCRALSTNSTASTGTGSSATLSSSARVEHELGLSSLRRLERARRLEELRELEAQLHAHRIAETSSLRFGLGRHWASYGPILAAVLSSLASLIAAYHVWQKAHLHGERKTKLDTEVASLRAQTEQIQRRAQVELQDAQKIIENYSASKVRLLLLLFLPPSASSEQQASTLFSSRPPL
jgi:hypothetical protein